MKDLTFKTFKKLGLLGKNILNCIDNPIAYAASYFSADNYDNYFLLNYYYDTWAENNNDFLTYRNKLLSYMGIKLDNESCNNKNKFIRSIQSHIDSNEPVFVFLDYFNMFYNKAYYKKSHISHGLLITGYDETNNTFSTYERLIIDPDGLYPFQMTDEMLYDMWQSSCQSLNSDSRIYYMHKIKDISCFPADILYNVYKCGKMNNIVKYVENYSGTYREHVGFYLRRHYDATAYLFEKIMNIATSQKIHESINTLKDEYLSLLDIYINLAIKNIMTNKPCNSISIKEKSSKLISLDENLFDLLSEIDRQSNQLRNAAFGCKVTASSTVTADISYSGENTVNGKYSDSEMMQNHWVSNDTDKVHWLIYDLGKEYDISEIVLYHIKTNVLIDYEIQGSHDGITWDCIQQFTDNELDINHCYLHKASYRYIRLYITNPSTQGTAARLVECQIWV